MRSRMSTGQDPYSDETGTAILEDVALRGWRVLLKIFLDRLIALFVLILLAPLLLGILVTLGLTSRRSPIVYQNRVGKYGEIFRLYKFRTTAAEGSSELEVGPVLLSPENGIMPVLRHGQKLTPVGRWLRLTGLDELPQLLNVLRGNMSLVGPRPRLPREIEGLSKDELRILLVWPGITGLAQVLGLSGGQEGHDPLFLDRYYMENWTPALDLIILFRTATNVFLWRSSIDNPFEETSSNTAVDRSSILDSDLALRSVS